MTGSGHVKYQENPLASKLHGNSAWKIISFYLLYSQLHIVMPSGHVLIMCMLPCIINDEYIFLSFGKDLHGQSSCHLYMAFQLLQNMASGRVKVKKGTGHVFYTAIPSHTTESVAGRSFLCQNRSRLSVYQCSPNLWQCQVIYQSMLFVCVSVIKGFSQSVGSASSLHLTGFHASDRKGCNSCVLQISLFEYP